MASNLDQALDEVIKDRRRERGNGNKRSNQPVRNNNRVARRDNSGGIRKRLGNNNQTPAIRSFVRTVNVSEERRGARNVNGQWSHDMFDEDARGSVLSRLGSVRSEVRSGRQGVEITIENLHYNVTEKDVQELFSTVADVERARIVFDESGRSTGVATVRYQQKADADKAIERYNNVDLDGQPMRIKIKEHTPHRPRSSGGRFNNSRLDSRGGGNRNGGNRGRSNNNDNNRGSKRGNRDDRQKKVPTAEDLDREMESYMNSNSAVNEDTDMMLD